MKNKILALILCAFMVIPFGALLSLDIAADDIATVYAKDGGSGDGSSESSAVGNFKDAIYAAAEKNKETKIVIVGTVGFDMSASWEDAPSHKKITIVGKDENAKLAVTTDDNNVDNNRIWYVLGELEFANLHIELQTCSAFLINTQFHDITFGDGMKITTVSTVTGARTVSLRIGDGKTVANPEIQSLYSYDANANTFKANPTFTLKSGTFTEIVGFQNMSADNLGDLDGTFTVNVSGDVKFNKMVVCRNAYSTVKNAVFNFNGGMFIDWVAACDRPATSLDTKHSGVTEGGTFTINIGKDFDITKNIPAGTSTTAFYGFGGTSCSKSAAKPAYVDKAEYVININEDVYDSVVAYVMADSFDSVNKIENSVPEQPEQPDQPDQPETGDATLVFAFVSAVALAGAVVVSKKRA